MKRSLDYPIPAARGQLSLSLSFSATLAFSFRLGTVRAEKNAVKLFLPRGDIRCSSYAAKHRAKRAPINLALYESKNCFSQHFFSSFKSSLFFFFFILIRVKSFKVRKKV